MSNTPDEQRDHWEPVWQARDLRAERALVNGLGLGMVVLGLAAAGVKHVDVVEIDPDVISFVAPELGNRLDRSGCYLDVHRADAYTIKWPVGTRWDVAWHDIWVEASEDNLEEMARLHRRYGRRVTWQGSWRREQLRYQRRRTAGWY